MEILHSTTLLDTVDPVHWHCPRKPKNQSPASWYIVEQSTTTTNGEGNQPRSTNQSEALVRRSSNNFFDGALHQTKTAMATNRPSRARTQMDSTIPQPRAAVQVVTPGNRASTARGRSKRTKAGAFGIQPNRPASQNIGLAWAWSGKNNI